MIGVVLIKSIFHQNKPLYSLGLPEYSYEELQETEVYYGDEVQLACRGTPAGDTPGPEPRIMYISYIPIIVCMFSQLSNADMH